MNHTARRRTLLVGCIGAVLTLVTTACSGQTATVGSDSGGDSGGKKTLKIAAVAGWDEDIAATYLWKQILEDKGYKVEVQELDIASTFTGVANKQVDLYLDAWLPATHETYWKKLGSKLETVSTWYSPADLNLSVPTYVKDVNTIADLKAHASEFDGQIVGIEAGSGLMRLTRENVIPGYGLKDDYQLTESSTSAMLSALQTAIKKKKPIVVTLWRPHWAYAKLPLKVLKDTKGTYGDPDKVQAIASKGFSDDHPELAGWLNNFKLTSDQLGSLELLIQEKGQGHEQEAAKEWIAQNETVVDAWLK
ncbi:glycine betaine ABC transporter substrate-binding protein [Streptomyces sp. NPDC091377]|uniref:glycine betaine ABC transporter substrate-binding protein n=1 Tax=Streptomyces sp. NPDC091377 TaxID=3365995 RepID=UPI00382484E7